jgi:hypothetical protein
MGDENVLRGFLEKVVPDWKDDDFARARFKAFTGQKQDWEEKLNFWRDMIIKVARHLDVCVIDTVAVRIWRSSILIYHMSKFLCDVGDPHEHHFQISFAWLLRRSHAFAEDKSE